MFFTPKNKDLYKDKNIWFITQSNIKLHFNEKVYS